MVNQFIEYRLDISKIPKDGAVIDIFYNQDETVSPISSLVPVNRYDFVSIKDDTMYLDIQKMMTRMQATDLLWDSFNVFKIYIYLPDSVLHSKSGLLEFVMSSCVQAFLSNVYKTQNTIIITHSGKVNERVKNCISMIEKVQLARLFSMLPANIATPEKIAKRIQTIFDKVPKVSTRLLTETYLKSHHFNLLLSVNQGSKNKACMLVVERKTNSKQPTVCIIGKGITFDSGGLAIKPLRYMKDMKYDKIGAVSGAMALLHLMELKSIRHLNLIGIFPFAENLISSKAMRPGDVIKSHLGKTVEISNPDAEGRLILADAFSYAHKYKPDLLIDIATLTGHAESISCWHKGYYFAVPDSLKHKTETITNDIGERMIPMPTWDEYREVLRSPVADLINDSDVCDDSTSAALFLKEFIPKDSDWLHIDLAHEQDDHIPNGAGIRSIIEIVDQTYRKKN
jgi:leucyl aminopeptidase